MKAPKNPEATIGRQVTVKMVNTDSHSPRVGVILAIGKYSVAVKTDPRNPSTTGWRDWSDLEPYGPEWDEDLPETDIDAARAKLYREIKGRIAVGSPMSRTEINEKYNAIEAKYERYVTDQFTRSVKYQAARGDEDEKSVIGDSWCFPDLRSYMKALNEAAGFPPGSPFELQESHERFAESDRLKMLRKFDALYENNQANNNERKDEMNHVAQAILDEKGELTKNQSVVIEAFANSNPFAVPEFREWFFTDQSRIDSMVKPAEACLARREEEAKG